MKSIDRITESLTRRTASRISRRSTIAWLGGIIAGSSIPTLPVARAADGPRAQAPAQDPGDAASCDYWRYCAIDGFLCECCGGSVNSCPPGTEMSPITWLGTCLNPADQRNYIISYNDCCGQPQCGYCYCNRNEGEKPVARPQANNGLNWCLGAENQAYTCSTAIIIGVALEPPK